MPLVAVVADIDHRNSRGLVEAVPGTLMMIAMRRNGLVWAWTHVEVKRDKCRRPEASDT